MSANSPISPCSCAFLSSKCKGFRSVSARAPLQDRRTIAVVAAFLDACACYGHLATLHPQLGDSSTAAMSLVIVEIFRAVPHPSSARSAAAQTGLLATPRAHQRYATRAPSATASGAHLCLRSGRSRRRPDGTRGTTTSKCEGLVATRESGLVRTAAATS